jgi:hypothetical protein
MAATMCTQVRVIFIASSLIEMLAAESIAFETEPASAFALAALLGFFRGSLARSNALVNRKIFKL